MGAIIDGPEAERLRQSVNSGRIAPQEVRRGRTTFIQPDLGLPHASGIHGGIFGIQPDHNQAEIDSGTQSTPVRESETTEITGPHSVSQV
jgi:hypothetical protein